MKLPWIKPVEGQGFWGDSPNPFLDMLSVRSLSNTQVGMSKGVSGYTRLEIRGKAQARDILGPACGIWMSLWEELCTSSTEKSQRRGGPWGTFSAISEMSLSRESYSWSGYWQLYFQSPACRWGSFLAWDFADHTGLCLFILLGWHGPGALKSQRRTLGTWDLRRASQGRGGQGMQPGGGLALCSP